MKAIKTLCGRCAMGCGMRAMPAPTDDDPRRLLLEGDRIHPANMGWLCPDGEALAQAATLEGRLLQSRASGRRVAPDRAIAQTAGRLSDILARHGPGSIALHVAGDLPTEDYYAANKLMKGFISSANIDGPWTDSVARAHHSAFGEDVMPGCVEDIERTELILVIGAATLKQHPMLHRRVAKAREERGTPLILIDADPAARLIPADLHLFPVAGSIGALLGGLLLHLHMAGRLDDGFLGDHVVVPDGFWDRLRIGHDLWSVARATGLSVADLRAFHENFGGVGSSVTLFGAHDGAAAEREVAAILNIHLATGRIARPGAAPFALPGAPNAMGAGEVGCVATALAAHRDFSSEARAAVSRFWSTRTLADAPGLSGKALAQGVDDGRIKALLMVGGVPAWLPALRDHRPFTIFAGDRIDPALSDRIDIALPMAGALERDGTLTGADRLISRQRPVFALPGEARPGWWIIARIARAMGWQDAFHYERPADIYREHARLSAYQDDGRRLFSLRRHAPVSNPAYQELTPWRWGDVPFDGGRFSTLDGRARLVRLWD